MNIIEVQDKLKGLSQQQLVQEMQAPSGTAPQYLVLGELQRRKRMQDDFQANKAKAPETTVAQDAVSAAGMPQDTLAPMARALAPNTDVGQNTGIAALPAPGTEEPQRMAGGGAVTPRRMAGGKTVERINSETTPPPAEFMRDPGIAQIAARAGLRPGQLWRTLSPEQREYQMARIKGELLNPPPVQGPTLDFMPVNPSYTEGEQPSFIMPPQEDLNRKYWEDITGAEASRPMEQPVADTVPITPGGDPYLDLPGKPPGISNIGNVIGVDASPARGLESLAPSDARPMITPLLKGTAAGRTGAQGSVDLDLTFPGPSFETTGRGSGSLMDQASTAAALNAAAQRAAGAAPAFETYGRGAAPAAPAYPFSEAGRTGIASLADLANTAAAQNAPAPVSPVPAFETYGRGADTASLMGVLADRIPAAPAQEATPVGPPAPRQVDIDRAAGLESFTLPELAASYIPDWLSFGGEAEKKSNPREITDRQRKAQQDAALAEQYALTGAAPEVPPAIPPVAAAETPPAAPAIAPVADVVAGGGNGSGGTGGHAPASAGIGAGIPSTGKMSSYEQELADAMSRADKRASQDKWLALAQAGMALMSSKNPTFGGALGEAGAVGLDAFRGSRDAAEKQHMDLVAAQEAARLDNLKLALSAARGGGGSGSTKPLPAGMFTALTKELADTEAQLSDPTLAPPEEGWIWTDADPNVQRRVELARKRDYLQAAIAQEYARYGIGAPGADAGVAPPDFSD